MRAAYAKEGIAQTNLTYLIRNGRSGLAPTDFIVQTNTLIPEIYLILLQRWFWILIVPGVPDPTARLSVTSVIRQIPEISPRPNVRAAPKSSARGAPGTSILERPAKSTDRGLFVRTETVLAAVAWAAARASSTSDTLTTSNLVPCATSRSRGTQDAPK